MKTCLIGLKIEKLAEIVTSLGEKPFRAKQLYEGIMLGKELEEMTNLPKSFISALSENYTAQGVKIVKKLTSKDGTQKYLFALNDGNVIESVVMEYKYGKTICVSTQVGCRMNCAFCASGLDGLVRNLTAGEILSEVIVANRDNGGNKDKRAITNIVLMGSGEPFDNYDNVAEFLRLVNLKDSLNVSLRNVSLSTCGLTEGVDKLIEDGLFVTLTFSLHAADDETRNKIMPVNKSHDIADIIAAAKRYFNASGRRVIFEYSMIAGVNDDLKAADKLAELVRGFPSHVNLIALNYVKERGLKGTDRSKVKAFCDRLTEKGVSATIRRTMGEDVDGACGQLRRKYLG
ncbi:MAG: 23S rRNA (adenine(2503)-C(2))-methyltransferase RlmN [Clostridia bacterium]|nr:23S rRNA (adenine(2503)-C(2))-methyltransferase RlmN [Clostridia bacterium]